MSDKRNETQELVAHDDDKTNSQQPEQQVIEAEGSEPGQHKDLEETMGALGEADEMMELDGFGAGGSPEFNRGAVELEFPGKKTPEIPQVSLTTEDQENVVPSVPEHVHEKSHQDSQHESQQGIQAPEQANVSQEQAQDQIKEQNYDQTQELETAIEDDIDTSILQPQQTNHQFTTPLKSLPPLKDIEPITTPKAFSVAIDADVEVPDVSSSPLLTKNTLRDLQEETNNDTSHDDTFHQNSDSAEKSVVSAFLDANPQDFNSINLDLINKLYKRSIEFQELKSDNEFLRINQEQAIQIQNKKFKFLNLKLERLDKQNAELRQERDSLSNDKESHNKTISELRDENTTVKDKLSRLEHESKMYDSNYSEQISQRDQEISKLNESLNKLTKTNIEQNQRINQIIKELNDTRNDKFTLKLENNKISNEMSYIKNQRAWYEEELKSVQERFTDLIKKHESEFLMRSNKLSSLTTKNDALEHLNKSQKNLIIELQKDLEKEISKSSSLDSKFEIEKIKLSKELKSKEELLELTRIQSTQRSERIVQLESYIEEIKTTLGDSVDALEMELSKKTESIVVLEEKLRRTEDVLDKELHKETDLPKLSVSAEMIASTKTDGISLSSLYSEYNHLKKQLVLERSQKERLANQLESFVAELESKKPTIANYCDQIKFYENSLQEMIGKVESIRLEKLDGEKEYNKLKSRLSEYNNDLVSMKKLCKDLGKQLCYYLIHSKIRDSNEDPLTLAERKAIENILERSGNNDGTKESDTDQLISDRLVGFTNIVDLQQKNEGLLKVVRQLGKKLESKDVEFNDGLESAAIDEAKEAILTLESELESVNIKLEAVTKERDVLKSMTDTTSVNGSKTEFKFLTEANNDLKSKLNDTEKILKELQLQSNSTVKDFNEKLRVITNAKNELTLKLSSIKHSAELAEARFSNAQASLENAREEMNQYKSDIEFWKSQSSKQESLLINKSNELKDAENIINKERIIVNNLKTEKEIWSLYQKSMSEDIAQLRTDKSHLNGFVMNLQSLLKERESSSKELSSRLTQSIENYQSLQERLSEKEERILILSNQSELALKAQNSKLEQVNELNQLLRDYKNELSQKNSLVEGLVKRLKEHESSSSMTNALEGFKKPTAEASNRDEFSQNYERELERIRNDVRIAESQVAEFSGLAKAAELALTNSTNTFENYKGENENKLNGLIREKEALEAELKSLSSLLNQSKQESMNAEKKYLTEVEELKLNIEESRMKADAYDDLQKDYDAKFKAVAKDLENQSKLSSQNQTKYQQELKRNENLTNELNELKNNCNNLESRICDLTATLDSTRDLLVKKDESLDEQKQSIQDELVSCKMKVKDLQDQNNVLLNQLELSKLPNVSDVSEVYSNDDLREVVSYLRREKDTAEAKLMSYSEDQNRLEQRLSQISTELETSKSELANSHSNVNTMNENNKEHDRLLEQLELLNILRESNTTLRNENNLNIQRISELESELQSVTSKLAPLEKKVAELSMQSDVKEQTIRLIKEENDKNKVQTSSNTDHEVAESDLEDIKTMKQRFTNLKNEFQNKLLIHRSKTKELEKTVDSLKRELANANQQLVDAKTNYEQELANAKSNTEGIKDGNLHNEQLNKTRKELEDAREKFESLKRESNNKIKSLSNEKASLENTLQSLKIKIDALESGNSHQKPFEEKLSSLKAQFENEKSEMRKNIENEFERKLEQELDKVNTKADDNQSNKAKETQIREETDAAFKEKYAALEKDAQERRSMLEDKLKQKFEQELKYKVEDEVSKRIASGDANGDSNQVRDDLVKQHQVEIVKLTQEFEAQLNKEKDDVKNVTEKKFEIKLRMLNKKLDKLEGKNLSESSNPIAAVPAPSIPNNNSTLLSSLPAIPHLTQNSTQTEAIVPSDQERSKLPLGHQFTESTLTVHRPTIDRSNPPNKTLQNQKPNVEKVGQKRPMVSKHQSANKKPKE